MRTESRILRAYAAKTPRSAALYRRARRLFPGGVTHVGRYLEPHPIYVTRAAASRKWDVDGNEYVDYFGGHGALILGHNHPAVVEAVAAQLSRGAHYGASHELELEWGEQIRRMVPCAERVRFAMSGTEATMLAMRVARAATGRPIVVRFAGHFHGWHDQAAFGAELPAGIPPEIAGLTLICPRAEISCVRELCDGRDDIAAVMLEPTGATFGQVPLVPAFLTELRDFTARRGIVLIFDEVITGFRCSPGGAQAFYGVTPDLAVLAKIVAGGYPGGALVGRADILDVLEHRKTPAGIELPKVVHQGTHNAAPIAAAAGIATLRLIDSTDVVKRANRTAATIREEMNGVIVRLGSSWRVYGPFSAFHIFCNPGAEAISAADIEAGKVDPAKLKGGTPLELLQNVRAGFLAGGVDVIGWPGGMTSAVHYGQDVDRTLTAFENLLLMFQEETRHES